MSKQSKPPHIVMSYSHSPLEHAERVRDIGQRLANDGVEVEIDSWSVREGDDINAFMESMVTNPSIDKVLIFSNASYAEKANQRTHGVGTEATILSAELYGKVKQDKFIPVVCEYDENGKACLPVFLRGRLYVDFSSPEREAENYERLLRRIFNRPEHTKPTAGTPPAYITDPSLPANPLASKLRSYREALLSGKSHTRFLLEDFLSVFLATTREQRIHSQKNEPFDETLLRSLQVLKPLRNDFVEVCELWIRSPDAPYLPSRVIRLLEEIRGLGEWPDDTDTWNQAWGENFRLFVHEVFLHVVALLLHHHEFSLLKEILSAHFVLPSSDKPRRVVAGGIDIFNSWSEVLTSRNQRLENRRLDPVADFLKERATTTAVPFTWLQQADLVCFVSSLILNPGEEAWYPHSLVFTMYQSVSFEIFRRAESKTFFQKLAALWGGVAVEEFKKILDERFKSSGADRWRLDRSAPRWEEWLNWQKLASRP